MFREAGPQLNVGSAIQLCGRSIRDMLNPLASELCCKVPIAIACVVLLGFSDDKLLIMITIITIQHSAPTNPILSLTSKAPSSSNSQKSSGCYLNTRASFLGRSSRNRCMSLVSLTRSAGRKNSGSSVCDDGDDDDNGDDDDDDNGAHDGV